MLKDITLGQYFPGDTIIHRLDARTKIILVVIYIVALFQAKGWIGYAVVTGATLLCMTLSKIKPSAMFKGVKPMLVIIVLTAALNIFVSFISLCSFSGASVPDFSVLNYIPINISKITKTTDNKNDVANKTTKSEKKKK